MNEDVCFSVDRLSRTIEVLLLNSHSLDSPYFLQAFLASSPDQQLLLLVQKNTCSQALQLSPCSMLKIASGPLALTFSSNNLGKGKASLGDPLL